VFALDLPHFWPISIISQATRRPILVEPIARELAPRGVARKLSMQGLRGQLGGLPLVLREKKATNVLKFILRIYKQVTVKKNLSHENEHLKHILHIKNNSIKKVSRKDVCNICKDPHRKHLL
jgi:hypothetical protein